MAKKKKQTHAITPWKNVAFFMCILLFVLSLISWVMGETLGNGLWLWPLLFVPLMLYFLGLMYGDVPARFYQLSGLQPFPIPFSMQFDRAVLAIVLLFSGITINVLLLILSLLFKAPPLLSILYGLYMAIVLMELPHSIRIFRNLQHIQIMRMNIKEADSLFDESNKFAKEHSKTRIEESSAFQEHLYSILKNEANELVREFSPLSKDQQFALNIAVRAGEAVWEARNSVEKGDLHNLEANLNIMYALCKYTEMEPPFDLNSMSEKLELLKKEAASISSDSKPETPES